MLGGGGEEGRGQEEVLNDASQAGEGDGHSKQEGERGHQVNLSNRRWGGAEFFWVKSVIIVRNTWCEVQEWVSRQTCQPQAH